MSDQILITGGTLIDASGTRIADLAISGGRIVDPAELDSGASRIDADGAIVSCGLVDLNAYLGEPGDEAAETISTATAAAAAGGFTTILARPDTDPVVDTAAVVDHVRSLVAQACCGVQVAATVTVGGNGDCLAPLGELAAAGVGLVTDCGDGIQDPLLMRRALEYARPLGLTIGQTASCARLAQGGQMNEGEWSSRLGLAGVPAEAEEVRVMRDIALARLTGGRIHFQTLSTAGALAAVVQAQTDGVAVTAEVSAHHLLLTDADLADYDTNRKLVPPLRSQADRQAARQAVADGIVMIVSDHTPQTTDRKERPFDHAEPGSIGLDTALAATLSAGIQAPAALAALSWRPAELLGLGAPAERALLPGAVADVAIIDPGATWTARAADSASLGTNCALEGMQLTGKVTTTIRNGVTVFSDGEIAAPTPVGATR